MITFGSLEKNRSENRTVLCWTGLCILCACVLFLFFFSFFVLFLCWFSLWWFCFYLSPPLSQQSCDCRCSFPFPERFLSFTSSQTILLFFFSFLLLGLFFLVSRRWEESMWSNLVARTWFLLVHFVVDRIPPWSTTDWRRRRRRRRHRSSTNSNSEDMQGWTRGFVYFLSRMIVPFWVVLSSLCGVVPFCLFLGGLGSCVSMFFFFWRFWILLVVLRKWDCGNNKEMATSPLRFPHLWTIQLCSTGVEGIELVTIQ